MSRWIFAVVSVATFVFAAPEAQAGKTDHVVYRLGNASSPKMDNVRTVKDADLFKKNGHDWVKGHTKGVSTFTNPKAQKGDKEWKLPVGSSYPAELHPVNDHGDHVSWQASHDMPLADYIRALQTLGQHFKKTF